MDAASAEGLENADTTKTESKDETSNNEESTGADETLPLDNLSTVTNPDPSTKAENGGVDDASNDLRNLEEKAEETKQEVEKTPESGDNEVKEGK